ncbi:endonuclease VIII [Phytohalomonas tamaricis]|uniref:endonuclease VIII n=1 Tax=Phytohalomonas tamaricis TaxID=2081032 RepID=UPI000D0BCA96|nr:endonuclease VIII [Phytohalomonas tamaricis]
MPEGPEIRRSADRLGKILAGHRLDDVWFAFDELKIFEAVLAGQRVMRVDNWGKALLTRFEDGHVLYSHNQLYGVWKIARRSHTPDTSRSLRVKLTTSTHAAWLYSASDISMWHIDTIGTHPFIARLGPDLLTHDVSIRDIERRLLDPLFKHRRLGVLLLDQGFYAGIGNYLRSEILFFAGLLPDVRPSELDDASRQRLACSIHGTVHRAYALAGVTNIEPWRQLMQEEGASRQRWRHAVFSRAGEPCFACGTMIERHNVASRRLYLCPQCQRRSL